MLPFRYLIYVLPFCDGFIIAFVFTSFVRKDVLLLSLFSPSMTKLKLAPFLDFKWSHTFLSKYILLIS